MSLMFPDLSAWWSALTPMRWFAVPPRQTNVLRSTRSTLRPSALCPSPFLLLAGIVAATANAASPSAQTDSVFGTQERQGATLIGIFYDLKQTQQHVAINAFTERYTPTIDNFIVEGFDESLLNRFFRAPLPLYTTQLAIPKMRAHVAPRAFGVAAEVKASYWVIHYKAQVSPPEDGTYRFVGNFDDVLVVSVNRKVVLDGCRPDTKLVRLGWKESADKGHTVAANSLARYGDWLELKAGVPVDLDILIGERPGGDFYGVLLYQKKGETYPRTDKGRAILPLFQTAAHPMTDQTFLTDRSPWTCYE